MSSLGHHRSRDRERNADARSESVRARSASRHELEEMEKDVKDGLWNKMVLCLRSMVALPPNLDRQSVYPNSSSSIGLALIVNNSRFENRDNRDGTDVDEQNMTKLLSSLGYIVYTNLNETAEQMMSTIRQFSRFGDHAAADSTVIVVLSHGEKDVVLGTDGVGINIHDFASQMNATACPQLAGKPKLTMAYARVKERLTHNHQNHVRISHLHVHDSQNQNWSCKCSAFIRIVSQKCHVAGFKFDFDDDVFDNKTKGFGYNFISLVKLMDPNKGFYDKGENKVKLAIDSHAWPGFVSWRNVQRGTWFVQCICRVFFKRAREDDLLTMMTQVNRMMQDFMSRDEKAKQVPMLVPAHRNILSASSGVFEAILCAHIVPFFQRLPMFLRRCFKRKRQKMQMAKLDDLSELNGKNAVQLLYAALKFNVFGLVKAFADFPISQLSNVFTALSIARFNDLLKDFVQRCLAYIGKNADDLLKSKEFLQIDQKLLCEIFERDQLQINGEITIWNAALRWADTKCFEYAKKCSAENRRTMLDPALYKIRFPLISKEEFTKKIVPTNVLTQKELLAVYQFHSLPNRRGISSGFFPMPFPTNGRISDQKKGTLLMNIEKVSEFAREEFESSPYSEKVYINGVRIFAAFLRQPFELSPKKLGREFRWDTL
ncbi:hypothetical protein niasHS_004423 [Heterodera schachtii]|uniref:Uncharacterized protein n=1 Tax=Heterodera schachtii TaxID=97005 RepID=A0ABD2JR21_HETSC